MSLATVRQKFPQYQDLSDDQLARGLHQKFYSDLPFDAFAGKIGYQPEQEEVEGRPRNAVRSLHLPPAGQDESDYEPQQSSGAGALGRIANAAISGAKSGYEGTAPILSDKAQAYLDEVQRQGGIKGRLAQLGSTVAGDIGAGMGVAQGAFTGAQAGVAQVGAELGAPVLGRDVAALPEAFMGMPEALRTPHAPGSGAAIAENIAQAKQTAAEVREARQPEAAAAPPAAPFETPEMAARREEGVDQPTPQNQTQNSPENIPQRIPEQIPEQNQSSTAPENIASNSRQLPESPVSLASPEAVAQARGPSGAYVMLDPDQIRVDPARFQFKEADDRGVTGALQGTSRWEPALANPITAWEDPDGNLFVVNGHQRTDLAQRAKVAGQEDVQMPARVFRAEDGYTPEYMRTLGAYQNIAEGTGTAIDAAKVMRGVDAIPADRRLPELPPRGQLVRDATSLAKLSDDAFGMVMNGDIPPGYAAHVGALIADPVEQMAALDVLNRAKPPNTEQARIMVQDIRNNGFLRGAQTTLFGDETFAQSLLPERARVLDNAMRALGRMKNVFGTAVEGEDTLAAAGNTMSREANLKGKVDNAQLLEAIRRDATSRGELSDALTAAARDLAAGKKSAGVVAQFLVDARRIVRGGEDDGVRPGGVPGGERPAGASAGIGGYHYRPMDITEGTGGREFFHGTKAPIDKLKDADVWQYSQIGNLYGEGLYLTDNPKVAASYSERKGAGSTGRVFPAKLADLSLVDLEQPLPPQAIEAFKRAASDYLPSDMDYAQSGKKIFSEIKEGMRDDGLTTTDAADVYNSIATALSDAGYDGFRHEGGAYRGKDFGKHNVVVLFENEEIGPNGEIAGRPLKSKFTEPGETPAVDLLGKPIENRAARGQAGPRGGQELANEGLFARPETSQREFGQRYEYSKYTTNDADRTANKIAVDALNGDITQKQAVDGLAKLVAQGVIPEGVARINLSRLTDWNENGWEASKRAAAGDHSGLPLYSFPGGLFDPAAWKAALGPLLNAVRKTSPASLKTIINQRPFDVLRDKKGIARAAAEIKAGISPTALRGAAPMEQQLRRHGAEQAQSYGQSAFALEKVRDAVDKLPMAEQIAFTDRMERGIAQPTPELQQVATALRDEINKWTGKVQSLGRGYLANAIHDYMGHIWGNYQEWSAGLPTTLTQAEVEERARAGGQGKSPLQGSKAFLKQRTFPTQLDGINAGLIPSTYNPIDLQMLKLREMQKFYHGTRLADQMKDTHLASWVPAGSEREAATAGLKQLDDRVFQPRLQGDANPAGFGRLEPGNWYAPEPVARIFNNYMSRGLAGNSVIFDTLRSSGNALNSLQLGLSGFHATFISLDTAMSRVALGLQQVARGDVLKGAKSIAVGATPYSVLQTIREGNKLGKAWLDPASATPEMRRVVDAFNDAGGRMNMDQFYRTNASGTFFRNWADLKNPASVLHQVAQMYRDSNGVVDKAVMVPLRIIGRTIDTLNEPLMGKMVPAAKRGVFANMARDWIDSHPNATPEQRSAAMIKAWDSVDNRMGQMVYDNVFWNKMLKDMAFMTTRSVGWNLGTIRELGGAAVDTARAAGDVAHGKVPTLTHRMSYAVAMTMVSALYGGMVNYAMTGEGPQELMDYFFPRSGGKTPQGADERLSMPGYIKDVIEYSKAPVQTILNKTGPLWETLNEIRTNKDYYGGIIVGPTDYAPSAYVDFMINQSLPFSLRAAMRLNQDAQAEGQPSAGLGRQMAAMMGVQPAPQSITNPERGALYQQKADIRALRTREREKGHVHVLTSRPGD